MSALLPRSTEKKKYYDRGCGIQGCNGHGHVNGTSTYHTSPNFCPHRFPSNAPQIRQHSVISENSKKLHQQQQKQQQQLPLDQSTLIQPQSTDLANEKTSSSPISKTVSVPAIESQSFKRAKRVSLPAKFFALHKSQK